MKTLYLLYKDSVCPICSGMIKQMSNPELYKCNDCKSIFKVNGVGSADKEITVTNLSNGGSI